MKAVWVLGGIAFWGGLIALFFLTRPRGIMVALLIGCVLVSMIALSMADRLHATYLRDAVGHQSRMLFAGVALCDLFLGIAIGGSTKQLLSLVAGSNPIWWYYTIPYLTFIAILVGIETSFRRATVTELTRAERPLTLVLIGMAFASYTIGVVDPAAIASLNSYFLP